MITRINVDGFKSLSNFKLDLNAGLNILVGPNGSGKTNIIVFFEFLTLLLEDRLGDAVSKMGGAGHVFRKKPNEEYQIDINITVWGNTRMGNSKHLFYKYECTISLTKEKDYVFFEKQNLSVAVNRIKKETKNPYSRDFDWDLIINSQVNDDNNYIGCSFKLEKIDLRKIDIYRRSWDYLSKKQITQDLNKDLSGELFLNESFLKNASRIFRLGSYLERDINGGETINIDPMRAKQGQDTATLPGIKRDGSGLVATLYALSKNVEVIPRYRTNHYPRIIYRHNFRNNSTFSKRNKAIFEKVETFTKLINPNIKKLLVTSNALDNLAQVSVCISSNKEDIEIPFSLLSDGTVKWITLITAILTHKSIFAIEEPENFLHPNMQKELINIMREETNSRRGESFSIMTTHSESLLNAADPKEIVVVDFENGKTKVSRPQNTKILIEEINRTGFGLGYYYVSGALTDD